MPTLTMLLASRANLAPRRVQVRPICVLFYHERCGFKTSDVNGSLLLQDGEC